MACRMEGRRFKPRCETFFPSFLLSLSPPLLFSPLLSFFLSPHFHFPLQACSATSMLKRFFYFVCVTNCTHCQYIGSQHMPVKMPAKKAQILQQGEYTVYSTRSTVGYILTILQEFMTCFTRSPMTLMELNTRLEQGQVIRH